jgi:O-acetyl-ADP-ribose deacetylase (regulator of RNase III)
MEERGEAATMLNGVKLRLVRGDITLQNTDAIVNAANSSLMGGGGVDGAIHRAGGPTILEECRQIVARQGRLATGRAVITSGGNLAAKHVIHTVGPVWRNGQQGEPELLASAYNESLKLAVSRQLVSVAFPSISTGAYGYPLNLAAKIAIGTVGNFRKGTPGSLREVLFVLFGERAFDAFRKALTDYTSPD